jgi:hypothetical protein
MGLRVCRGAWQGPECLEEKRREQMPTETEQDQITLEIFSDYV